MVDDISAMISKQNLRRQDIFHSVYTYLNGLGLTETEQDIVSQAKLIFPFEKVSSIDYLESMKSVPPRSHFTSLLRGESQVSESQYSQFQEVFSQESIWDR